MARNAGVQVEAGVQVLVVVRRDLQEVQPPVPGRPGGGHEVVHGERDVLLVGPARWPVPASVALLLDDRGQVQHQAHGAVARSA